MKFIEKYFQDLTEIQKSQFESLGALYAEWNAKINVISRKDIDQLYLKHVLHSLSIAKYVQFNQGSKIIDVGTGGGFPGIPLAIMFPESEFLLIDSIGKKIKVVEAIYKELGIQNCKAVQIRAEDVKGIFDFVISRAVTSLPVFVEWVKNCISKKSIHSVPNGIIYLKGGDLSTELDIPYHSMVINISDYFDEAFFETKKIVHVYLKDN
jgi:16S rRNA (guanine527-N7)-methyltransferase